MIPALPQPAYVPAAAPLDDLVGWDTWRKSLEVIIAGLTDLPEDAVSFALRPRPHHRGPRAQLQIIAIQHIGVDELRRTDDAGELTEEAIGQRSMVLQVRFWAARQSLEHAPRVFVERLRTRLRWTSTTTALLRCALAFQRAEQPVDFVGKRDSRMLTSSLIDLRLGYAWVEGDTENAMGWIAKAQIVGTLRDPAGVEVPLSPVTIDVDASTP